jgi:hypothetical protein
MKLHVVRMRERATTKGERLKEKLFQQKVD